MDVNPYESPQAKIGGDRPSTARDDWLRDRLRLLFWGTVCAIVGTAVFSFLLWAIRFPE